MWKKNKTFTISYVVKGLLYNAVDGRGVKAFKTDEEEVASVVAVLEIRFLYLLTVMKG